MAGKYTYITFDDRKRIEKWYLSGEGACEIAARLGIHNATVYRELQRGSTGELDENQRLGYSAELAEKTLQANFKRRGRKASPKAS